jgi:hypothetical protein
MMKIKGLVGVNKQHKNVKGEGKDHLTTKSLLPRS